MSDREPPARNEEPKHISDQTNRSSSKIVLAGELLSIDGFITEGPERKFPITQQLLAQGKPTIVIAQNSEARHQPKAIMRPPSTTQAMLRMERIIWSVSSDVSKMAALDTQGTNPARYVA